MTGSKNPATWSGMVLSKLGHGIQKLVFPILVIGIWEASSFSSGYSSVFPTPSKILHALGDWIFGFDGSTQSVSGQWLTAATSSLTRVLSGYVLAIVLGVIAGIVCSWWEVTKRLLEPTVQMLRFIPPVSWIPLSIIWFGIGDGPAVFLVFLASFFHIFINTTHGIISTPENLLRATEMMSASSLQKLIYVALPHAVPSLFTGLRTGLGAAWMTVVTSEMIAVKSGLGYSLWDSYNFMRLDLVVAAMLSIGVIGYLSDFILRLIYRRVMFWKEP
ncbi:ABC transporter permease [Bifidobacterium subtile]|jgi:NitT/TauT family transport system permease protein|uniref:ABC transporter permease n=1 Tax=Bifidobacterium subtile TaxID=77635 RepID=UPI002F354F08